MALTTLPEWQIDDQLNYTLQQKLQRARHDYQANTNTTTVWKHTQLNQAFAVLPRRDTDDHDGMPPYDVAEYFISNGRLYNKFTIFRAESPADAAKRLRPYLSETDSPDDPNTRDAAVDADSIKYAELKTVRSLSDWAYLTGADFYITEKIGNRKQSSGDVAHFSGSTRRGEGAYVALADENGPRGKSFISVGRQTGEYYTIATSLTPRTGAYEITSPTVSYDGEKITATDPSGKQTITIRAKTGQ